ncbi:hypothetical protein C8R44DRAFT_740576 [Mycena epipterygia]|nr:hypothetical protein C8R44DRAFT_740576 [Mycena epipterygia]
MSSVTGQPARPSAALAPICPACIDRSACGNEEPGNNIASAAGQFPAVQSSQYSDIQNLTRYCLLAFKTRVPVFSIATKISEERYRGCRSEDNAISRPSPTNIHSNMISQPGTREELPVHTVDPSFPHHLPAFSLDLPALSQIQNHVALARSCSAPPWRLFPGGCSVVFCVLYKSWGEAHIPLYAGSGYVDMYYPIPLRSLFQHRLTQCLDRFPCGLALPTPSQGPLCGAAQFLRMSMPGTSPSMQVLTRPLRPGPVAVYFAMAPFGSSMWGITVNKAILCPSGLLTSSPPAIAEV